MIGSERSGGDIQYEHQMTDNEPLDGGQSAKRTISCMGPCKPFDYEK